MQPSSNFDFMVVPVSTPIEPFVASIWSSSHASYVSIIETRDIVDYSRLNRHPAGPPAPAVVPTISVGTSKNSSYNPYWPSISRAKALITPPRNFPLSLNRSSMAAQVGHPSFHVSVLPPSSSPLSSESTKTSLTVAVLNWCYSECHVIVSPFAIVSFPSPTTNLFSVRNWSHLVRPVLMSCESSSRKPFSSTPVCVLLMLHYLVNMTLFDVMLRPFSRKLSILKLKFDFHAFPGGSADASRGRDQFKTLLQTAIAQDRGLQSGYAEIISRTSTYQSFLPDMPGPLLDEFKP